MKLSNLSVIFIVIAIPLILILSYYISLQRDTINLQTSYNTKLLESTKEAIEAFEINTVEWNEAYSETEDSKRRDIMAAINTFTTSLANNLGVSGTSKEFLLTNIPAVAFTLYDGCYIYSPSETKFTVKDEDGVTQIMSKDLVEEKLSDNTTKIKNYSYDSDHNGEILYEVKDGASRNGTFTYEDSTGNIVTQDFTLKPGNAKTTENHPHVLKPFTAYTEALKDDWVISYTLDNYVTVYGEIDGKYTSKSGYLNLISENSEETNVISIAETNFEHNYNFADGTGDGNLIEENNPLREIKFSGQIMKPELLTETIAYKDGTNIIKGKFNYVYEAEKDTKVYFDGSNNKFFRLNNDLDKIYIEELTEPLYKKCTIPTIIDGKKDFLEVYRSLADGQWYVKDSSNVYIVINDGDLAKEWDELLYHNLYFTDVRYDYSAINYCVEAYVFTNELNDLGLKYSDGTPLKIEGDNDPEYDYSNFTEHKKEIIKSVVVSNLNQAITSYSDNSPEDYKLPMLKETEWDQVLSNVSIITFLQNIPIGLKYYNNYAIATSTLNKEYVDPDEIYLYDDQDTSADTIYHSPYCSKLDTTNKIIGYRSIDFIYKYFTYKNSEGDKQTSYYFRHSDETDRSVNQSCYYCLIQRALYEKISDPAIEEKHKIAYYTALARERYLQLESITIEQSDITVTKTVDKADAEYGEKVTYTITITNNATVNDSINIVDYYDGAKLRNVSIKSYDRTVAPIPSLDSYLDNGVQKVNVNEGGTLKEYDCKYWKGINIEPGETITIKLEADIEGAIGNIVKNTVGIYAYSTETTEIATATTTSRVVKKVAKYVPGATGDLNVIMALDNSSSMIGKENNVKQAVEKFANVLSDQDIQIFTFEQKTNSYVELRTKANGEKELRGYGLHGARLGTNYLGAFHRIYNSHIIPGKDNIIVFMTDGCPTATQTTVGSNPDNGILANFGLDIAGTLGAVIGGWLELMWTGPNQYGFSLMITDTIPWLLQSILDNFEIIYPEFNGLGLSQTIWKDMIMPKVEDIKSTGAKIYTVYYDTSNSDAPKYGLEKISSQEPGEEKQYYYDAEDATELVSVFEEIAKNIKGTTVNTETVTSYDGYITLEQVSKITKIKVGETEHGIDTFIDQISVDSITDIGILNLNDFPDIFHTAGEITIIY